MKPADLTKSTIRPTLINSHLVERIEVDLKHVNYGLDPKKGYGSKARSNFKIEDIVAFFESLHGLELEPESDENWEYFAIDKTFFGKNKKFRMVFCIDLKDPKVSGVITLFQIKR